MSIRFESVTKRFGNRTVLNEISFRVNPGEILFVLGKSGMGKSVTLKTTVGLLTPESGSVWVNDDCVSVLSREGDAEGLARVRGRCGMVFQHPALLDSLTVLENVGFGLKTPQYREKIGRSLSDAEIHERVVDKLALVQMGPEILERLPGEISHGMQKRVSLARTLAQEPEILLFDEPTTALDPITTQAVNTLIRDLSRRLKVTSVVVSHDMACALQIADRILVLDEGKVLALATVDEILQSKETLIRDFLRETLANLPQREVRS